MTCIRRKWREDFNKEMNLEKSIYVGVNGPSYESPAEAAAYAKLGGDVIGMSTVLEAMKCKAFSKPLLGLSFISNFSISVEKTDEAVENLSTDHKAVLDKTRSSKKLLKRALECAINCAPV